MANLVYENGTKEIAVPAGEKIAMYSMSPAVLSKKVGYPISRIRGIISIRQRQGPNILLRHFRLQQPSGSMQDLPTATTK